MPKNTSSSSSSRSVADSEHRGSAFLFDLDGTLIDSVYQHVVAWREALEETGIELAVWRIHRQIGMSAGLFVNALLREIGRPISPEEVERLQAAHIEAYRRHLHLVRPLPGARELLTYLTEHDVPWAIATSGRLVAAGAALEILDLPSDTPLITRDLVRHAKPDPDLFLAAAAKLGVDVPTPWWWETAFGISSRHVARGPLVSVCSLVVMDAKSSRAPEPIAFIKTLPIYFGIWMKSECALPISFRCRLFKRSPT